MLCLLIAVDSHPAGRIDSSMLTEHQRMELFFTPEDPEDARSRLRGDPDDACTWLQVACDDEGNVGEIDWPWHLIELSGSINFQMLPRRLELLNLSYQELVGDIDLQALPDTMKDLFLRSCNFTGTLDFGNLPRGLTNLHVMKNKISALVSLTNLPNGIDYFRIAEDSLQHTDLHIGALPEGTEYEINLISCGIDSVTYERPEDVERVILSLGDENQNKIGKSRRV